MRLVVDASPLILLAAAGQLSLLRGICEEIVVPDAVLAEIEAGSTRDNTAARIRSQEWLMIGSDLPIDPTIAPWDLGAGESAVLGWAKHRPGFTCALDDRAARNCARVLSLPHVGTLGLVLAAKELGLLPAARPILEEMVSAGYYLAGEILEKSLEGVGE